MDLKNLKENIEKILGIELILYSESNKQKVTNFQHVFFACFKSKLIYIGITKNLEKMIFSSKRSSSTFQTHFFDRYILENITTKDIYINNIIDSMKINKIVQNEIKKNIKVFYVIGNENDKKDYIYKLKNQGISNLLN